MLKNKQFILLITVFLVECTYGQVVSNIDFDAIKYAALDKSSSQYYPKLLKRFQSDDSTLTESDYTILYYGGIFQDAYHPYGAENEDEFLKKYNQESYRKAIRIGENILSENPVNLNVLFKICVCYYLVDNKTRIKKYVKRYNNLLDVIYRSGDGTSIETAYVVIYVSDEYRVVDDLNLDVKKQVLSGSTDILYFDTKKQSAPKIIKQLYFNVSKPLIYLSKSFQEE
jgi:hypothetical protein